MHSVCVQSRAYKPGRQALPENRYVERLLCTRGAELDKIRHKIEEEFD